METKMKILKIKTGLIKIPLITPFKTSLRTVDAVEDVIVCIETDSGLIGFGEAPPTAVITGDTIGSIRTAIHDYIAPALCGMELEDIDGVMHRLHSCMQKNTSAKAAVDMAVYDLYAKNLNRPLYKVLGGNKQVVETDITISLDAVDKMVEDSRSAVDRGFSILKIKVGKEEKKDIERIKAIRKEVGPKVKLRVDANQGWNVKEAVRIITALEDALLDIELVEQPVNAHDFYGMKYITGHTLTPILADESVFGPMDAVKILEEHAADMINIKLMKTGGIHEALKICGLAEMYGITCMLGCMLESKVSVSAAAHLAAARSVITAADLDGCSLCKLDPYEGGPVYDGAFIHMTDAPGIGITGVPVNFD
jgi:o-succinylbenzoate synthase